MMISIIQELIYIIFRLMDQFLSCLDQQENIKQILRGGCKKNKLNTSLASSLTIPKLKILCQKFKKIQKVNKSSNEQQKSSINDNWMENELKAYNWIMIAYSGLKNVLIQNFEEKDWKVMEEIFENKSRNFLQYQARRCLEGNKCKNKDWSKEEDTILSSVIHEIERKERENDIQPMQKSQKQQSNHLRCENDMKQQKKITEQQKQITSKEKVHWNQIARRLFQESSKKYFRTAKHCRQRWLNYIDPTKERGKWRDQQDSKLLSLVSKIGKRWAQIAAQLHRTQHSVKNRYNSLEIMSKKDSKRKRKQNNFLITQKQQQNSQNDIDSKQEQQMQPKITINLPKQKQPKPQQINGAQYLQMQGLEQVQPYLRTDDPSISTRGQCYILSPFSYSPKNLTPFMRSPSPLTFSLFNYRSFIPEHQQTFEGAFKSQGNIFLNPPQQ